MDPDVLLLNAALRIAGQYMQNVNWLMALLALAWFIIAIIYIVVRATKSLHLGKATAYGVWVLVMEVSQPTHLTQGPLCLNTRLTTNATVEEAT